MKINKYVLLIVFSAYVGDVGVGIYDHDWDAALGWFAATFNFCLWVLSWGKRNAR